LQKQQHRKTFRKKTSHAVDFLPGSFDLWTENGSKESDKLISI